MTRFSKLLLASTFVCALPAQSAFAQGEGEVEGEVGAEVSGEVDVDASAGGEASMEGDATGEAAADPMVAGGGLAAWPREIILRPLTLNAGMLRLQGDLGIARLSFFEPISMTSVSATSIGLGLGVGYGVSDKIEVGGGYGFSIDEFEIKGPLSVYGRYRIMDGAMRAAAHANFTYNLASETAGLGLGVDFWYNLSNQLTIFTPGNQLQVGIDPSGASIDLPVAVGFQATPNIFAAVQTSLATIGIDPSGSSFIFADRTPFKLGGFYSPSNKMDFGVSIETPNIGDIGDFFIITATARLFM